MIEITISTIPEIPEISEEFYDIVFKKVFKQIISNRPDYHDTRGCNGKSINELFRNGWMK